MQSFAELYPANHPSILQRPEHGDTESCKLFQQRTRNDATLHYGAPFQFHEVEKFKLYVFS